MASMWSWWIGLVLVIFGNIVYDWVIVLAGVAFMVWFFTAPWHEQIRGKVQAVIYGGNDDDKREGQ